MRVSDGWNGMAQWHSQHGSHTMQPGSAELPLTLGSNGCGSRLLLHRPGSSRSGACSCEAAQILSLPRQLCKEMGWRDIEGCRQTQSVTAPIDTMRPNHCLPAEPGLVKTTARQAQPCEPHASPCLAAAVYSNRKRRAAAVLPHASSLGCKRRKQEGTPKCQQLACQANETRLQIPPTSCCPFLEGATLASATTLFDCPCHKHAGPCRQQLASGLTRVAK